ncbi:MAG TPA: hypothetical protein VGD74_05530 [Vulgatibacter sp.]
MAVILATRNVLLEVGSSSIMVSGPSAPGFAPIDMIQGDLDCAWLADGPSNVWNIDVRLPPGLPVNFAAIFDVRPLPAAVTLFKSAVWPITIPSSVASLFMKAERGDGARLLGGDLGAFAARFQVTFATPVTPSIGKIWLGVAGSLPGFYLSRDDAPAFSQIRNDTETGGSWRHELADMRERFTLNYNNVTSVTHGSIFDDWKSSRGGLLPSVLIPDELSPSRAYFGRFEADLPTALGVKGIRSGLKLPFVESGRSIRVG